MSLAIYPIPTLAAMTRALDVANGGIALQGQFIQFGEGFQTIELDGAGRAITDTLASPLGKVAIGYAERVNDVQWRLEVDIAGVVDHDFNLSEIALLDENDDTIALWSSTSTPLFAVSTQIDSTLISINLLLATLPSNSLEILHQDFPVGVFNAKAQALEDSLAVQKYKYSPRVRALINQNFG